MTSHKGARMEGLGAVDLLGGPPCRRVIVLIHCEPMLFSSPRGVLAPQQHRVALCFNGLERDFYSCERVMLMIRRRVIDKVLSIRPFDSATTNPSHYRYEVVNCQMQSYQGLQLRLCCWSKKLSSWYTIRLDRLEESPRPLMFWPTPMSMTPVSVLRVHVRLRLEPFHCSRPVFHDFFDALLHKRRGRGRQPRPLPLQPPVRTSWLSRKMAALGIGGSDSGSRCSRRLRPRRRRTR